MHKHLRSTYLPVCNKQIAAASHNIILQFALKRTDSYTLFCKIP